MNDPWYRETCNENGLTLRDMYRLEENGNTANREHLKKPMSKWEREQAGLHRWIPNVEYDADQGGNDSNYRNRQPKAKAQKTWQGGKGDSGCKRGQWSKATRSGGPLQRPRRTSGSRTTGGTPEPPRNF